jgi:hypothetical protein
MTLSTIGGNAVLDALLNNTALAKSPFASLHTADPGLVSAYELTGSNYGRVAVTFGAPTGGAGDNSALVTFPTASGDWTTATYFGIYDAGTSGNFLGSTILTNARTVLSGQYAEFAIGALDLSIGTAFGTDTLANIVNALFRNTSLQVTQAYMSLHSGDPGATGANELANSYSYARVAASFGAAATKSCANDAVIDTPACTGTNWLEATYAGLWTSGTYGEGTFIFGKQLTVARTVQVGKFFRMAVGGLTVTIT